MSKRFEFPLPLLLLLGLPAAATINAQTILTCQATVNPILVRGEGLTERMGDILLQCTGGLPNQGVQGNLSVFLSVPITNRVNANGDSDLMLTLDTGLGPIAANAKARYLNPTTLSFSGVTFNLSPTGSVTIRLSNLRGAANQAGINSARQITAYLSFNAGALISFSNNIFPVGTVLRSLYSSNTSRLICSQAGSPSIDTLSLNSALAVHAAYSTVRITEGFPSSLAPRTDQTFQNADFGSRVIVRFSGVPAGVRLFVPDGIVGYDGLQPTSAGDYGLPPADGLYTPGTGTLLLLRIANADLRGGGIGSGPVVRPPTSTTTFDSLGEVTIGPDGTGQAVYEVFDSNNFALQSATIPAFISVPPNTVQNPTQINQDVFLGPVSSTFETTPDAVIPRFILSPAPNDCAVFGDCGASYFPKLNVNTTSIDVSLTSLDGSNSQYFVISNAGSGNFLWNATVTYITPSSGYQWLKVWPTSGINRETPRVDFVPGPLPPGIYDAIITIDGGPIAGSKQIHVTMRLSYLAPTPVLMNAVNSASMKPGALVPGSQASIIGSRLSGNQISVMFNGSPGRILNPVSASRLDVQVPYDVAGQTSTLITVTIDGSTSAGILIPIAASNPAIFANAILNEDNTGNNATGGALAGSTVQVYATGLPVAGVYSGQIHDRIITGDGIVYAGPAPTFIGIQLVKMVVPADLPTLTTSATVCGGATSDTQICSDPVNFYIIGQPPPPQQNQ